MSGVAGPPVLPAAVALLLGHPLEAVIADLSHCTEEEELAGVIQHYTNTDTDTTHRDRQKDRETQIDHRRRHAHRGEESWDTHTHHEQGDAMEHAARAGVGAGGALVCVLKLLWRVFAGGAARPHDCDAPLRCVLWERTLCACLAAAGTWRSRDRPQRDYRSVAGAPLFRDPGHPDEG
jgi:hypothetical protein